MPRADEPAIEARNLSRSFGPTRAVEALDLRVLRGELFGLVGPDGAGKTTTLRLLAGLLELGAGEARVGGFDLSSEAEAVKPKIGYMAQQFSLYDDLSVLENLEFFADLYTVIGKARKQRIARLLEFARLTQFQDRRAAHLSGGMQKKLSLACTLIHQPEILLLDEPTTGVDPLSRREFWEILSELHLAGISIVVSTPYMDEAERCQRVGLMYSGRLVVCDPPGAIQSRVPGELVEFAPDNWRQAHRILQGLPGVLEVQAYGNTLRVFLDSARGRWPAIEAALQSRGIHPGRVRQTKARMEEAFISLIRQLED